MRSGGAQLLAELRGVADVRVDARRRIADVTAEHGNGSAGHAAAWAAYRAVNDRWSTLIREAAAAGRSLADVARAAGCARPSLDQPPPALTTGCLHLDRRGRGPPGRPVLGPPTP